VRRFQGDGFIILVITNAREKVNQNLLDLTLKVKIPGKADFRNSSEGDFKVK
jgi:hypothetical protein